MMLPMARTTAAASPNQVRGKRSRTTASCCLLCHPTTRRGYHTGTGDRARPGTPVHDRHARNTRFAGRSHTSVSADDREYRSETSMVRRGSTVRVRQRACEIPATAGFLLPRAVWRSASFGRRAATSATTAGRRRTGLNREDREAPPPSEKDWSLLGTGLGDT